MRKNENGSVVIETLLSFILFACLCWCILTIINITTLQARVHHALTQTAIELSVYGYALHALGFSEHVMTMGEAQTETAELIGNITTMINTLDIDGGIQTVDDIMQDPMQIVQNLLLYVAGNMVNDYLVRPIFEKYLQLGDHRAPAFLHGNRVRSSASPGLLSLSDNYIHLYESRLITPEGNIILVATYGVDFTFGILPMPERFGRLTFQQTAKTKVWLGGYGEVFSP